jgi:hypothetical protein
MEESRMHASGRFLGRCFFYHVPGSKIHQLHSKYDEFPSQERRLKNVGALPLMAAHKLLGKDERSRAWYEARGRKEAHGIEGKSLRASTEKRNAGKPRPYPSREIKQ